MEVKANRKTCEVSKQVNFIHSQLGNGITGVMALRRIGLDILIPEVRTESAKNGTSCIGAQTFNNLPPHLKEGDSIVILF